MQEALDGDPLCVEDAFIGVRRDSGIPADGSPQANEETASRVFSVQATSQAPNMILGRSA